MQNNTELVDLRADARLIDQSVTALFKQLRCTLLVNLSASEYTRVISLLCDHFIFQEQFKPCLINFITSAPQRDTSGLQQQLPGSREGVPKQIV